MFYVPHLLHAGESRPAPTTLAAEGRPSLRPPCTAPTPSSARLPALASLWALSLSPNLKLPIPAPELAAAPRIWARRPWVGDGSLSLREWAHTEPEDLPRPDIFHSAPLPILTPGDPGRTLSVDKVKVRTSCPQLGRWGSSRGGLTPLPAQPGRQNDGSPRAPTSSWPSKAAGQGKRPKDASWPQAVGVHEQSGAGWPPLGSNEKQPGGGVAPERAETSRSPSQQFP